MKMNAIPGFPSVCLLALVFLTLSSIKVVVAGITERVSVASDGTQGNLGASAPSLSTDGRYVAFQSNATNLVPFDGNRVYDIFIHDRKLHTTERVSVTSAGSQGILDSWEPSLSADGRYVAFQSNAFNLVPDDTNGQTDIFVHDRQLHTTERVSVTSDGSQGIFYSSSPSISADGRYVAFSGANLVPQDNSDVQHVYIHDRQRHITELISRASDGTQGNNFSGPQVSFSADGRYVAYTSGATNLVPDDTNGAADIFVHDRQLHTTERVSVTSDGTQGNQGSGVAFLSPDGRYVAYTSGATNLVPDDTNGQTDIFVHDRQLHTTERVSVTSDGTQANSASFADYLSAFLSSDGRYVAFLSYATNLAPGTPAGGIFIHDRQLRTTELLSVAADAPSDFSAQISLSADGRYVAFWSHLDNLVTDDTNGKSDVFVYDRGAIIPPPTTDSDHDGLPDWYEDKYGLNKIDPSDANHDADGDGLTNLQEFVLGTDPKDLATPTQSGFLDVIPTNPLDFGSIPVGQSSTNLDFTVRNTGNTTLTGTCTIQPPFAFTFGPCTYDLAPNEFADIPISFSPMSEGTVTSTVAFSSNGGTASRQVTGTGTQPPPPINYFSPLFGIPKEFQFTKDLQQGSVDISVRYLQIVLNADSDTLIKDPGGQLSCWIPTYIGGAPGCETEIFGPGTAAAVIKFQEKHGISPAAGFVGPSTRGKLNELLILGTEVRPTSVLDRTERESAIRDSFTEDWLKLVMPTFSKKLALAVAGHETGGRYGYNNEWTRVNDSVSDFGRGIMQVTTASYVGQGSGGCANISNLDDRNNCEACKTGENFKYQCSKYYSNTLNGIKNNILDGLSALKEKYDQVKENLVNAGEFLCGDVSLDFTTSDMINISSLTRYNGVINNAPAIFLVSEGLTNHDIQKYFSDKQRAIPTNGFLSSVRETCAFVVGEDNTSRFTSCLRQSFDAGLISNYLYLRKVANALDIFESNPDPALREKLFCADTSLVITWIASPAELLLVDASGRKTGEAGSVIFEEVPNAIYDNESKVITQIFPLNTTRYHVRGTQDGRYGLIMVKPASDVTIDLRDIPIKPNVIHEYTVDWQSGSQLPPSVILSIDNNGDGVPEQHIQVGNAFSDTSPPLTAHTITSSDGQQGWYTSDVSVSLSADDGSGVGVQSSSYSLDNSPWEVYSSANPIVVTTEGIHTLSYYSTDFFGNIEARHTITIKIDKTSPEAAITVDPSTKDLKIVGLDNSGNVVVSKDASGSFLLTDVAGNVTKLFFKKTYTGKLLTFAQLVGIQYGSNSAVILPKTTFVYVWNSKVTPPTLVSQTVTVNNAFVIEAAYNKSTNKTTVLVLKKGAAVQKLTYTGLKIVKITINKGVVGYQL